MTDNGQPLESAIEANIAERRLAAQTDAEMFRQSRRQQLAERERLRPFHDQLIGRIRAELSELARLLESRGLPQETLKIMGTKTVEKYGGRLAFLGIGKTETVEIEGIVDERRFWVIEKSDTYIGDNDKPSMGVFYTKGFGIEQSGGLLEWKSGPGSRISYEAVTDFAIIPYFRVRPEDSEHNERLVDEWHHKIVGWGTKLLGDE